MADLPEAWDEKMKTSLGVSTAGDFRKGCMQDVHFFTGAFGYFPCYTLGAVKASQIYRAAEDAVPDLENSIRRGSFDTLVAWLRANVHGQGALLSSMELVHRVTGSKLGTEAFLEHLESRYVRNN